MKRVYRFILALALGLGLVVIALASLGAGPTQPVSGKTSSVVAQPPTLGAWRTKSGKIDNDETSGGFAYGPELPVGLYRLEGEGWNGRFYVEQGAAGGFNYSTHNQLLVQCPWCAEIYLPVILRNYTN